MQNELNAEYPELNIQLLTIGRDDADDEELAEMSALGDLPMLWDTDVDDVWESWDVTFRDVVILDENNQKVTAFNLTRYSLGEPENRVSLKALLIDVAD